MFRIRRFGAITAVALFAGSAALTATAPATAAPALTSESAAASSSSAFPKFKDGPRLLTDELTVKAGKSKWVKTRWKTNRDICDVEVTVEGKNVEIEYPDDEDFTSFNDDDSLEAGDTDFTAFNITAKKKGGDRELDVTISYTQSKWNDDDDDDDDDDCEGKERSREFTIDLEVKKNFRN